MSDDSQGRAFDFARRFEPLVVGTRGQEPDYVRFGAFAACDTRGRLVAWAGDPAVRCFMRSSAKPFQAIAFLRRDLDHRLGVGSAEVACACASHSGEERHVEAARRILRAAGAEESDLACGTHEAVSPQLARRVARGEADVTPLTNNCSAKHAAMIATCLAEGWPVEGYTEPEHPLQVECRETLAAYADGAPEGIDVAVDNCSVPTFGLPLRVTAQAFARLRCPERLPDEIAEAGLRAVSAMLEHPEMVGGTGRLDTSLMEVTEGRLLVKTGANGHHGGAALSPGVRGAVGFAFKMAGAEAESRKALALIGCLEAAELLTPDEARELRRRHCPESLLGCRSQVVGHETFVGTVDRG